MPVEIVKVQMPLSQPYAIGTMLLVYDKKQKHMKQQPCDRYTFEKLNGDYKAFFKGAWSSVVGWGLSDRVEDEDW